MLRRHSQNDYQPVTRTRGARALNSESATVKDRPRQSTGKSAHDRVEKSAGPSIAEATRSLDTFLKRGHAFSYAALFAFTLLLYARPGEFYPSPWTQYIALICGILTLAFFVPTQFALEGKPTAALGEVNLVLLFGLAALLSIPLAINPSEAWHGFSGTFIRCIVMFVVIVNVVRTETRLKGLLFLAMAASIWLSVEAIYDYRMGLNTIEGYRASGRGGGIFGNTNDMALHIVTILPIAIALLFGSRGMIRKLLYGAGALMMVAAIVLSYSRGAFIGMVVILIFFGLKMGRSHRFEIVFAILAISALIIVFAPENYGGRLLSIFIPSLDAVGSADARRGELFRSIYVALRHPLLGIGMDNYQPEMSNRGLVTHNSYTQVAAEIGMAGLVCYTLFILTPLRKLSRITRETFEARGTSSFYYLALGLQASLIAYMVCSFFLSVAFNWYVFYLVGYAVCLRRIYESETGKVIVLEKRGERKKNEIQRAVLIDREGGAVRA